MNLAFGDHALQFRNHKVDAVNSQGDKGPQAGPEFAKLLVLASGHAVMHRVFDKVRFVEQILMIVQSSVVKCRDVNNAICCFVGLNNSAAEPSVVNSHKAPDHRVKNREALPWDWYLGIEDFARCFAQDLLHVRAVKIGSKNCQFIEKSHANSLLSFSVVFRRGRSVIKSLFVWEPHGEPNSYSGSDCLNPGSAAFSPQRRDAHNVDCSETADHDDQANCDNADCTKEIVLHSIPCQKGILP